ncbi:MAG: hypothetical protein M1814_004098 [Vezdaea aestivalis]|nr:MAG: hypothetical protein M1814_004098 [Vezdaea aestivalis]
MPENYPPPSYLPLPIGLPDSTPLVQYSPPKEDRRSHTIRLERQAAVKESFEHAWNGYKQHAWLKDEVSPLTGTYMNSFGGRAATLYTPSMKIDFSTTELDTLNLSETTIRYLGGLLAAYDISGQNYSTLVEKAVVLGDFLYKAFDTPNRMPITRWEWKKALSEAQTKPGGVLVSEIGSLTLEFTRLSQITKNPKYFDAIQRIMNKFEEAQNHTKLPGMWPVIVDTSEPSFGGDNTFTYGGMSDSTYEYLPKQYMLLGGLSSQYQTLYEGSTRVAKEHILFRPMNQENLDIMLTGNARVSDHGKVELDPQGQHLTCFAGGMYAIGGMIFNHPEDIAMAEKIVKGCLWAYDSMPTGIMPETFYAVACTEPDCSWNETAWREASMTKEDFIEKIIVDERLVPGFSAIGDRRYILRPELIESVFILYRITGDKYWQEAAWKMFTAIKKYSQTEIANAALDDVTVELPPQSNRMESFWLAETLKYFYLIYSDFDNVSLDEYVLNTEAHPFKRP